MSDHACNPPEGGDRRLRTTNWGDILKAVPADEYRMLFCLEGDARFVHRTFEAVRLDDPSMRSTVRATFTVAAGQTLEIDPARPQQEARPQAGTGP